MGEYIPVWNIQRELKSYAMASMSKTSYLERLEPTQEEIDARPENRRGTALAAIRADSKFTTRLRRDILLDAFAGAEVMGWENLAELVRSILLRVAEAGRVRDPKGFVEARYRAEEAYIERSQGQRPGRRKTIRKTITPAQLPEDYEENIEVVGELPYISS